MDNNQKYTYYFFIQKCKNQHQVFYLFFSFFIIIIIEVLLVGKELGGTYNFIKEQILLYYQKNYILQMILGL